MTKEIQDLAWAVLPKEFKEEVKRVANIFSRRTSGMLGGERTLADTFLNEFINLFGRHNLTSDAEGEEMLMCEKSRVQKIFAGQTEAAKSTPCGTILHHEAAAKAELLYTLFGSKCLPDEAKDGAKEPKPAEPKFKVGDKVKYKGRVKVVISEMMPNRYYRIALPNNQSPICKHESDLEPYTEPTDNPIPRIRGN